MMVKGKAEQPYKWYVPTVEELAEKVELGSNIRRLELKNGGKRFIIRFHPYDDRASIQGDTERVDDMARAWRALDIEYDHYGYMVKGVGEEEELLLSLAELVNYATKGDRDGSILEHPQVKRALELLILKGGQTQ